MIDNRLMFCHIIYSFYKNKQIRMEPDSARTVPLLSEVKVVIYHTKSTTLYTLAQL